MKESSALYSLTPNTTIKPMTPIPALPDDHQGGRAAQRIHFVMAKILKSNNKEASPGNPLGLAFLILEV